MFIILLIFLFSASQSVSYYLNLVFIVVMEISTLFHQQTWVFKVPKSWSVFFPIVVFCSIHLYARGRFLACLSSKTFFVKWRADSTNPHRNRCTTGLLLIFSPKNQILRLLVYIQLCKAVLLEHKHHTMSVDVNSECIIGNWQNYTCHVN